MKSTPVYSQGCWGRMKQSGFIWDGLVKWKTAHKPTTDILLGQKNLCLSLATILVTPKLPAVRLHENTPTETF